MAAQYVPPFSDYRAPAKSAATVYRALKNVTIPKLAVGVRKIELTGMLLRRGFLDLEEQLTGNINVWEIEFVKREDDFDIIIDENGTFRDFSFHQIRVQYSVNDRVLSDVCRKNDYQKFIPGKLICTVCTCDGCGSRPAKLLFDFTKNFKFGECGCLVDKFGKKDGLTVAMYCTVVNKFTELGVCAILEGFGHQSVEIGKMKIFGMELFGQKDNKPPLSILAYAEIESLNNDKDWDFNPKISIHFTEKIHGQRMWLPGGRIYENTNTVEEKVRITGVLLGRELDEVARLARATKGLVPDQKFDGKEYPRVEKKNESEKSSGSAATAGSSDSK